MMTSHKINPRNLGLKKPRGIFMSGFLVEKKMGRKKREKKQKEREERKKMVMMSRTIIHKKLDSHFTQEEDGYS